MSTLFTFLRETNTSRKGILALVGHSSSMPCWLSSHYIPRYLIEMRWTCLYATYIIVQVFKSIQSRPLRCMVYK